MKKTELIFNLVSIPIDAIFLIASALLAFYTRMHSENLVGPVRYTLTLEQFLWTSLSVVPVLMLIFALLGLYNLKGTRKFSEEFVKIFLGVSLALFLVIVLFFFNQQLFPSRFIVLASWGYAIVLVFIGRFIMYEVQKLAFRRGMGLHNLVIVIGEGLEAKVIEDIFKNPTYGYRVLKEVKYSENTISELTEIAKQNRIDEVIQANPKLQTEANLEIVEFAKNLGLQFSFVPNLFDVQRNVVEVQSWGGVPVISIKNTPLDGWGKVAKRVFDILGSSTALLLLSPVFLAIYLAIKIDSKGPAIYPALRGGKGKDFWFYKFRSMYAHLSPGLGGEEAEKFREKLWENNDRGGKDAPFLKIKNDPRVTKVGSFLRKTKLDEIPQFWNVLKGDMSLVGPRAHVLDEVQKYRDRYQRMFSIKPGIFGLSQNAQILDPELPFEEEIRNNIFYIENWTLWLDIKILVKSFYLLIFGSKSKETY